MEKKKVFVIMPFTDQFFEVYEMLKVKFEKEFEFTNAGDEGNQQNILKDIIQPIFEADIIIADLTGLNPNVMYELGLAHSFNKKTIIITQDELSTLPFDLKQYRAKNYNTYFKKFEELIEYLETNLSGAANNSVSFSNPVKDFLKSENLNDVSWFSEKAIVEIEDESEKGFLDFIADIESDANDFTMSINQMISDMSEMSSGIIECTTKIERANKTPTTGNAAFVRKETKKAAKHIDNFNLKLRQHNKMMATLWNKIETNTLGLLENNIASNEENLSHLIDYLKSLKDMKTSILESNISVEDFKNNINDLIGMERSMNQAIKFLQEDLSTYISNTELMVTSIDKILNKSKFVVGELGYNLI